MVEEGKIEHLVHVARDKVNKFRHVFSHHQKRRKSASQPVKHLLVRLRNDASSDEEPSTRNRVLAFLECTRFEVFIMALILIELISVIVEVTITNSVRCGATEEHRRLLSGTTEVDTNDACPYANRSCAAADVFRWISFGLLCFFMGELCLKFSLCPKRFVTHMGHVVDFVVVFISLLFEVLHLTHTISTETSAVEVLIILRAWHAVRIGYGFYEEYHTLLKHEHVIHDSEEALQITLDFLDDKGLHDEFLRHCQRNVNCVSEAAMESIAAIEGSRAVEVSRVEVELGQVEQQQQPDG